MSTSVADRPASVADAGERARWSPPAALGIAAVNVAVAIIFSLSTPEHVFFEPRTFISIVLNASEIVLLGAGVACLLGGGEFDISLGANVVLSSVLGAKVMNGLTSGGHGGIGLAITAGIVTCVLTGAAFGAVNGFIVARLRVSSLIATLGMLGAGTGTALVITGGSDVLVPAGLQSGFGIRSLFGGVPVPALVTAVLALAVFVLMTRTRFGLRTLAAGSSRDAARRSGLRVEGTKFTLFVLAGSLAGVAAVIDLSRYATTSVGGHQTDALAAIAGAVLGGTALFGGRISIGGTVLGCVLPVMLQVGLILQGLQPFYQQIAVGLVLIAAVAIRSRRPKSSSA